jgi:hypothetical protein
MKSHRNSDDKPFSTPHGPHPDGVDDVAGGADSSPYENLSSQERHEAALADLCDESSAPESGTVRDETSGNQPSDRGFNPRQGNPDHSDDPSYAGEEA